MSNSTIAALFNEAISTLHMTIHPDSYTIKKHCLEDARPQASSCGWSNSNLFNSSWSLNDEEI
jgi:hypothetical protein